MSIDLDGSVAIVTGAGRGLGRAEALELAAHGARVVVNDFGASLDGQATGDSAGQEVAAEIRAQGGEASAHHGDVADWDDAAGLVQQAVSDFGGLDVLVNNAGIIRDRMIFAMSEEDFDAVVRVHLKGHFCTLAPRDGVVAGAVEGQRTGPSTRVSSTPPRRPRCSGRPASPTTRRRRRASSR